MRGETVTYKIYQFEELTEEAQENAYEKYYDYNLIQFEDVLEDEYYKECLNDIGFENADINFSGFSCQGDGASFESDVNIDKIFSYIVYQSTSWKDIKDYDYLINLMNKDLIEFSFWNKRISHHYSHENTCRIDSEIDIYLENCSLDGENWIYQAIEDFEYTIEDIRHEKCQTIYYKLRDYYESLQTEECLKETFIECEIEFNKDGTIY